MKKKQTELYEGVARNGKTFVSGHLEHVIVAGIGDPRPLNRKSKKVLLRTYRHMQTEASPEFLDAETKKKASAKIRRKKVKAAGYLRRRANNKRK